MTKTRKEFDSLGSVDVPADKLWAAQTERSRNNFKIGHPGSMPIEVIYAFALLKKSIAHANCDLGILSKQKRDLISRVCDEIQSGKLNSHFPLVVWQTGSGTQTNMNINEVIVNRAKEISKKINLHPNDDVNKSQSSNDTFPTAMNIAALNLINRNTVPALKILIKSLKKKSTSFSKIIKIGRTHFMDATPITLGQEFSGYVSQIEKGLKKIYESCDNLSELAIGGTAVGTGLNTINGFDKLVVKKVNYFNKIIGNKSSFISAPNKFEALSSNEAIVSTHHALKQLSLSINKIANDIRISSSGPRSGIGEIILPANEPGSSIMPGKVNPTQCESITMVCSQVFGNDAAISFGATQGHFQLNVFRPMIIYNFINSARILGDACNSFSKNCIEGIKANKVQINKNLNNSLMLVTALNTHIGYDRAAKIAKHAYEKNITLKESASILNILSEKDFDKLVNPTEMIAPNKKSPL
tara:strand:- start:306 stop:1715 length:1410 start_codon:yes stop_codon:yes gene_type:complete